ncbi:MAG: tRNA 4-thiouridine(8) synthase ThiI [Clostridia bacterium]|nr:tRNA 4-thiouridine(8) synthase ThiI [Clostridia bacterium]
MLRLGELFLKGSNRGYFERVLFENVKNAVADIACDVERIQSRILIKNYDPAEENELIFRAQRVFGLHSLSPAVQVETDMQVICETALTLLSAPRFRVSVNRADKRFPLSSMQIAREVGGYILSKSPEATVDLHNPDCNVQVDVREDGCTYLYSQTVPCERGMPYGTSGKGLLLLSGGIDSPVAGYMMAKRGMTVEAVHFHSYPYTSQMAREKVEELASVLKNYTGGRLKLYCISVTEIQQSIHESCQESFMITLLRRFMMKLSCRLARENGLQAILTGESLAQVASQTVESINVTNSVTDIPVLRPLIAIDKIDITETAKKIGTYEISIRPYEDCCTLFLPKNPVIRPRIEEALRQESRLDVEGLLERAYATLEIVEL